MSAELVKQVKKFFGVPTEDEIVESTSYNPPLEELKTPHLRSKNERAQGSLNNIIDMNSSLSQSEMFIVEPKSFEDASDIVESLRSRKAVIINLNTLEADDAQRLIDFVAGATYALDGNQEQIGDGIFLFSPSNVVINSLGSEHPWLNRDARDLFWRVK